VANVEIRHTAAMSNLYIRHTAAVGDWLGSGAIGAYSCIGWGQ